DKAEEMYYTFYEDMNRYPQMSPFFLQAMLVMENHSREVVVLCEENKPEVKHFLQKLKQSFLPDTALLVAKAPNQLEHAAPFAANYKKVDNQTTVYICENFTCKQPTTDLEKAIKELLRE
ncbi:hypothetical protein N8498_04930, partial [Candidatus Pseudothioglobus singularis]|nr:hypothetical protein [Candidatus Pseudothioglobus singularis]